MVSRTSFFVKAFHTLASCAPFTVMINTQNLDCLVRHAETQVTFDLILGPVYVMCVVVVAAWIGANKRLLTPQISC